MPTITSAGTFTLDGNALIVPDDHVTESAIIIAMLQAARSGGAGAWSGHHGIVDRVPGESFTFAAGRPGCGAKFGYLILES